jgi:hypothetical protein
MEADNRMRWAGQPGHYEVWYATLSHAASRTGFWIRYTMKSPLPGHGDPYAQLWFARFDGNDPANTFGINQRRPISTLSAGESPFSLRIGEALLTDGSARGALSGGGHDVRWELSWQPAATTHRPMMSLAYKGGWAPTQAVMPNLDVRADGEIVVDGKRYEVTGAPLGQAHIHGKKHGYAWAWSHCNDFGADRACFESLSARLRRGSVVLPPLNMMGLFLDGEEPIVFREPWELPMVRSEYGTGRYLITAVSPSVRIRAEYTSRHEDMIMAEYEDPDGDAAFCHNTECADLRIEVERRSPFVGRWRAHKTLISTRGGHYEWGARAGDPLVKKRHVTI